MVSSNFHTEVTRLLNYARFRHRPLPSPRTKNPGKDGEKILSGQLLGVRKQYRDDGSVLDTVNITATGPLDPSILIERFWDETHPGPPFRDGGNMASLKIRAPFSGILGTGRYSTFGNPNFSGKSGFEYIGKITSAGFHPLGLPYEDYINVGPAAPWSQTHIPDLSAYSLKAWDLIRPKIEKAGGGQFIGELSDLPRMLKTSALGFRNLWHNVGGQDGKFFMHPKKAADHFLNHHFGWVPFINDLIKFYDVYENSEKYIREAMRNNDRWVKRKRTVLKTSVDATAYEQYSANIMPALGNEFVQLKTGPQGQLYGGMFVATKRTERHVWAMGKFTMYRPEFDPILLQKFPSNWSRTRQLLLLYGFRINPDVLWRITPWSWLVDWFVSIGRNIDIFTHSILDSVAAKYAYLMCTETNKVVETHSVNYWSGAVTFNRIYTIDTKVRNEMLSPYGFNYGWDQLSPKQLGILGALGISRKR